MLDYKPVPLRWPFLFIILVCISALIGVLEHAQRTLPDIDSGSTPKNLTNIVPPSVPVPSAQFSNVNQRPLIFEAYQKKGQFITGIYERSLVPETPITSTSEPLLSATPAPPPVSTTHSIPKATAQPHTPGLASPFGTNTTGVNATRTTAVFSVPLRTLHPSLTRYASQEGVLTHYGWECQTLLCPQCKTGYDVVIRDFLTDDQSWCPLIYGPKVWIFLDKGCAEWARNPTCPQPTAQVLYTSNNNGQRDTFSPGQTLVATDESRHAAVTGKWIPPVIVTERDAQGRPTHTITDMPSDVIMTRTTMTLRDAGGQVTQVITSDVPLSTIITLFDPNGVPVSTITEYGVIKSWVTIGIIDFYGHTVSSIVREALPTTSMVTLVDANGVPTSTGIIYQSDMTDDLYDFRNWPATEITWSGRDENGDPYQVRTSIAIGYPTMKPKYKMFSTVVTLTDSNGVPTATVSMLNSGTGIPRGPISPEDDATLFRTLTGRDYFLGSFVPTIIGVLLSSLIQIVNTNIKLMLPFKTLTQPGGATAEDSLCLIPGGVSGAATSLRLLRRYRDPLPVLGDVLLLVSALLVSVSSETVVIEERGGLCRTHRDQYDCTLVLGKSSQPTRIAEALLGIMAVLLVLLCVHIYRWRSGVSSEPWSIAYMASLLPQGEVRDRLQSISIPENNHVDREWILAHLRGRRYVLREIPHQGYGICTSDVLPDNEPIPLRRRVTLKLWMSNASTQAHLVQSAMFVFLCALLVIVLVYELTEGDSNFERFMDSQGFGVRFLFTAFGVFITFFWDYYFSRTAMLEAYWNLSKMPMPKNNAVFQSPATTVFTGLWRAVVDRNPFAGAVSFAGILAKFTPVLLSNIPFRAQQTWQTHEICTWMLVGILVYMMLVLLASRLVKMPYIPVEPSTIAGAMYYLCDSPILDDFKGYSSTAKQSRKGHARRSEQTYRFGKMIGVSGALRTGVDQR